MGNDSIRKFTVTVSASVTYTVKDEQVLQDAHLVALHEMHGDEKLREVPIESLRRVDVSINNLVGMALAQWAPDIPGIVAGQPALSVSTQAVPEGAPATE